VALIPVGHTRAGPGRKAALRTLVRCHLPAGRLDDPHSSWWPSLSPETRVSI